MSRSLFITGSSGFVAGHLLKNLALDQYERICCLSRSQTELTTELAQRENFQFVQASVLDPARYESHLASADTVIHLAAITGRARREDFFSVNTDGTKILVDKCRELGIPRFLHTSTIAVKYKSLKHYYYAESKQLAEDIVRNSGLDYTIIRPTIVLGADSLIGQSLQKMASGSVIMMPGNGHAKIQPVHIDDLVACIALILQEQLFDGKTLDIGGPEVLSFEDLLQRIHHSINNKAPRIIHLPLRLMQGSFSFVERYLHFLPPVTAGQLSAFGNDGLAADNDITARRRDGMKSVRQMIGGYIDE